MGWSCTAKAARTAETWEKHCLATTGTQNVFFSNGKEVFFEIERKEFRDGRIVGTIVDMEGWKVGDFRINGDGTVAKAPKILHDVAEQEKA